MALFNFNRNSSVHGIELKEITIEDEQLFLDYLMQSNYDRVSYYNSFYYLCALNLNKKRDSVFMYAIVGEWLLTFERSNDKGFIIKNSPINKNGDYSDMDRIYRICIGMISYLNKSIGVNVNRCYNVLTSDVNEVLNRKKLCRLINNYKEFVFWCNDLIELKGKEYKGRRHMINKLNSEHPDFQIMEYTKDDKQEVMTIYNSWTKEYTERLEGEQVCNVGLTENTFNILMEKSNNYRTFVGVINGHIEGFIVIVPLCKNTKCVLIEYTNLDIKGLAEALWYGGLKLTTDLGDYENDGTGGKETDGLFFYKNSHKPVDFVNACELVLNKTDEKISKSIFKNNV